MKTFRGLKGVFARSARIAAVGWFLAACPTPAAGRPESSPTVSPTLSPYLDLIGIGWSPRLEDGPRFVWHSEREGVEPAESVRIFKQLAGGIDACLADILQTDSALLADLARMGPGKPCGGSDEELRRARALWASFGLADVLEEIAKTGRRGKATASFLARCDALGAAREKEVREAK